LETAETRSRLKSDLQVTQIYGYMTKVSYSDVEYANIVINATSYRHLDIILLVLV